MRGDGCSTVVQVEAAVSSALKRAVLGEPGQPLVVAVSGGADSLCLLYVLHRLSAEFGWMLHVAHLDHLLRGDESKSDARFVALQAAELGLACTVEARDVAAHREVRRCSLEEAARELRYAFLADVAHRIGAGVVLTGHTQDDAVETIMLHLLRGSGVHGLRGLELVSPLPGDLDRGDLTQRLRLVRPMLQLSRRQAEEYCAGLGLEPRRDASNESTAHRRNRVRLELLPALRQLNPRIDETLLRLSRLAAEDDDTLSALAQEAWGRLAVVEEDCVSLDRTAFLECAPAIQSRLVLQTVARLNGSARDVAAEHVFAVRSMAARGTGGATNAGAGITWRCARVRLVAHRVAGSEAPPCAAMPVSPVTLCVPGEIRIPGGRLSARYVDSGGPTKAGPLVAFLDAGSSGDALQVRRRRPGDRFRPLGMTGEKKLQDFLVDAHVDSSVRDGVPIVCSPHHIVWVAGLRIDDRVRVTPETRAVLRLDYIPEPASALERARRRPT
jgi:tRNA(Ile)-lysidine synthase